MLGVKTNIVRGQAKTVTECLGLNPQYIVIGPGPGSPAAAHLSKELILTCSGTIPLLGVCLGHQALAECFGGTVAKADIPMHGKTSRIFHQNEGVFADLPQGFQATRYHSLIVEEKALPACLKVTARTETGEIMGLRHVDLPLQSVQFHPESILTENGLELLKNFLT